MIDSRLFARYGINLNKNLKIDTHCPKPFDTLLVDHNGSCYICECTSWLPQSVGNLQISSIESILKNDKTTLLQNSIIDGSYRYCNNARCSWLLYSKNGLPWKKDLPEKKIKEIRLAVDNSCNLSCPSCRTNSIFFSRGAIFQKRMRIIEKIISFLISTKNKIHVHVGSDGDPFASLIYRHFFRSVYHLENLTYSLQTNGLLIEKMYYRIKNIFDKLTVLNISMDGASKYSYELLRRGASYDAILKNLKFVKKIKKTLNFKFSLHFVVQKKNYKEIFDMIEIAKKYDADEICLNKIEDWNTYKDFNKENITDNQHSEYNEYKDILKKLTEIYKYEKKLQIKFPTLVLHD